MHKTKFILLVLVAIVLCFLIIAPQFKKLPKDFSYEADVVSLDNFYDEAKQQYSGEKRSVTKFSYEVTGIKDGMLAVKNVFDVRKITGEKIFAVERLYGIDPKTGQHVAGYGDRERDGYLFAPKNLIKGEPFTYWHINYDGPAHMTFVREENLLGLQVYRYETDYKGVRIDQTKNLTNLPGVGVTRGIELEPRLQIWVEPVTGRMVKYEDNTVAYYYDLKTGARQNPWNHFSNKYTSESVIEQVGIAKKEKFIATISSPRNWFASKTQKIEKIVVGNLIGEYSTYNLIAQENGYFKKNGLDMESHIYDSGPPAIADLLAGKVDLALAAEFPGVRTMFMNDNLRIVAQLSRQDVFRLVGRTDKGISKLEDLKGKKIGLTITSAGEFHFNRFLDLHNLSAKDMTIINLTPSQMSEQIADGQIDVAVTFDPHAFNISRKLGDKEISWSIHENQKTFLILYSTDEFIKTRPKTIERYVRSLVEAEHYLQEHEEEVKDLVTKTFNYEKTYTDYIWPKFDFGIYLEQALLLTMEDEARWAIANKLTDKTVVPNYIDFIYTDALRKVKLDGVTLY